MTRNENLHFCGSNDDAVIGRPLNRIPFFGILTLASLCLLICVPSAFAVSKTKSSKARSETRSRRVENKRSVTKKSNASNKRSSAVKRSVAEKRKVADRRGGSDRVRSNVKMSSNRDNRQTRERVHIQQTAKVREIAITRPIASNVRQTVMVQPKQVNNFNAERPTLVNDIVIISEAPAARGLSSITRSSSSGNNMPSIWPVAGAIRGGFGVRHNPFGGPGSEFHKGQDISAPYGSQVIATADGVVVIAGWLRGYGQVVYVDHGNGISTRYGHLSRIDVMLGQTIKRGDQLGLVGSTGRSTGPHLHYEVRVDGMATYPIPYLPILPILPVQPVTTSPAIR